MKKASMKIFVPVMALLSACAPTSTTTPSSAVVQDEPPPAAGAPPVGGVAAPSTLSSSAATAVAPYRGKRARLFVVGMGPGGPDLVSVRAVKTIESADVIFCEDVMKRIHGEYLQGKDVRGSWQGVFRYKGRDYLDLRGDEVKEWLEQVRVRGQKVAQEIRDLIARGKTVAILEFGDPLIYGPIRHYMRFFTDDEFEVVPGMSALNAANALLKREAAMTSGSSTLILAAPFGPKGRKDGLEAVAALQSTIVIYMGMKRIPEIARALAARYSPSTPVAIVYWAGVPGREKVLRSTLARVVEDAAREHPDAIALIYVGRFLDESFAGE